MDRILWLHNGVRLVNLLGTDCMMTPDWESNQNLHTSVPSWPMPLYGTDPTASASDRSEQANTSSNSVEDLEAQTGVPRDESRQRLLGGGRDKMTLLEVLYAYDLTVAQLMYQRFGRDKLARIGWELLSHTGDGILWFLMVLPVIGIMWLAGLIKDVSPSTYTVFIVFYMCNVVDILSIVVLKSLVKRQRPPHNHVDPRFVGPDKHSFPSGHATRSWCIIGFILDLCNRHPETAREFFHLSPEVLRIAIVLWGLAVGFSRVALGRHYPSDVVAGSLIGLIVLYPITKYCVHAFTPLTDF